MGGKYSRIMMADRLKEQKDNLDLFNKMTLAEREAAYAAKKSQTGNLRNNVGSTLIYLKPFSVDNDNAIVQAKTCAPASEVDATMETVTGQIATLASAVAPYMTTAKPTGEALTIVKITGQRGKDPAKVTYTLIGAKTPKMPSRITKNPYTYRKQSSVSSSFGKLYAGGTEGQTFGSAFEAIRVAIASGAGTNKYRVYGKPEQNLGIL